jgi:hypothetical protein
MFEAIEIITKLFSGKDVKHDGRFFKMETCRLWTLPEKAPPIYIATAGPVTAKRTGQFADGLITVGAPEEKIEMVFGKFEEGPARPARTRRRCPRSCSSTSPGPKRTKQAVANAVSDWPNGGMKFPKQDIRSPRDFEQMAALVRPEDFKGRMLMSADPEVHRREIQKFLDMGFDQIYLHNVGRNQAAWIDLFGREVLPNSSNLRGGRSHAFGQTYHRYQPCCEWGETYFGRGPVSLASAQEAYGPTFQLIVVRLAGPPLGWLGAADAVTVLGGPPGQAPSLILLQEGPDLYYPYHTGDGMTP